jgi:Sigma-70 region 2
VGKSSQPRFLLGFFIDGVTPDRRRHLTSVALVNDGSLEYYSGSGLNNPHLTMVGSEISSAVSSRRNEPDPLEAAKLMRAVANKDRRAFESLYYAYAPRLGRFLVRILKRRDLVDEVLNDVMLVVWQSAERYDPERSRLSTWLFGIAHNKALKALSSVS